MRLRRSAKRTRRRPPGKRRLRDDLNFLVTNRIPRKIATRFMGWFSRIEIRWVRSLSIGVWNKFSRELDLTEAKKKRFDSLHDCFIRELENGSRPIDTRRGVITSPCDAIVGAHGRVEDGQVIQAKGFPYPIEDLLADEDLVERYRHGTYVTMRLKASMYHRFHAPCDARVRRVTYISGDTWNVNPVALERVERLFCRNERAVIDLDPGDASYSLTLVPVAAILVASIQLHFLDGPLDLKYRGPNRIDCNATFKKGEEIGYFQHGSTIIMFAQGDLDLCEHVEQGARIRVGQPLMIQRAHGDSPNDHGPHRSSFTNEP